MSIKKWVLHIIFFVVLGVCWSAALKAQTLEDGSQSVYQSLHAQMVKACPNMWEDLGANMDTATLNGVLWEETPAGASDKAAFIALMQQSLSGSNSTNIEAMADDVATVATECASHRVALLDALISKTPRDVLLAMDAVNRGLNKSIEYLDGGWSTGDVRITGRLQPQDGWVFLTGQTVGNKNTNATLAGDQYSELFELAKNWAPNRGNESWSGGAIVRLPDMRGRALVGMDNMGGRSAGVVSSSSADRVGGAFGKSSVKLAVSQMPSHKHSLWNAGNHSHSMSYAGLHHHHLYTSHRTHGYVGAYRYTTGYGRKDWHNVIYGATNKTGNHRHTIGAAGVHTHRVTSAGGNQPFEVIQPSIVFNVEMKL